MNLEVIKFTHLYDKLFGRLFTTIRRRVKVKPRDYVKIQLNEIVMRPKYRVISIDEVIIDRLPTSLLLFDCMNRDIPIRTRFDCYKLFSSFYVKPIDFKRDIFYLILLERVKENGKEGNPVYNTGN